MTKCTFLNNQSNLLNKFEKIKKELNQCESHQDLNHSEDRNLITAFFMDMLKKQTEFEVLSAQLNLLNQISREIQGHFNEFIRDVKTTDYQKSETHLCALTLIKQTAAAPSITSNSGSTPNQQNLKKNSITTR